MHTSRLTAFGLLLASCSLPGLASAQSSDGSWGALPDADEAPAAGASAPSAPPVVEPAPVTPPPATQATPAPVAPLSNCRVTPSPAVDRGTGVTIGGLVCDALRSQMDGVGPVSEGYQPGLPGFDISIQRLGRKVILKLQRVNASGKVDRTETLTLSTVEEATEAAPRLAAAMSEEVNIKDTARVDNLVGEETRRYKKKRGESLFGMGIGAQMAGSAFAGSTLHLSYQYETPDFALLARGSVGGLGDNEDDDWMYNYLSVGGRYFFSSENISPFLGGGLNISGMSQDNYSLAGDDDYHYEGNGGGAYAEVGVEALRLHRARLEISIRVDLPFYSLKNKYDYYGASENTAEGSKYVAPVSFNATMFF
ncbi:MAG: hypothetical protein KC766_35310 [Myxococcales bacterium]|nr:hypothetical protein [Myxococcales bacterium]